MRTLFVALLFGLSPALARADIQLVGKVAIPGDARDASGKTDTLPDGTPHDRLGSHGSAVAYDSRNDCYWMVADRGPANGTVPYHCRFHKYQIRLDSQAKAPLKVELVSTHMMTDTKDRQLVGIATAFDPLKPRDSLRFDAEGVRVGPKGTLFISDEYGPFVREFGTDGKMLRELPVPARFAFDPENKKGRQDNRGFEGLAISPDGKKLFALLQSPLIQDGALNDKGKRVGLFCRMLEIDIEGGKSREFAYPLDEPSYGPSELLAVNDHEFLVIERDGKPGKESKSKKIYRIDIANATEVQAIEALPTKVLPAEVKPITKRLFIDLLDPKWDLVETIPGKVEGLAFGPSPVKGQKLLIVTTDNDLIEKQPTWVWAFGIGDEDLPGYVAPAAK